jgi:hypothetical protein
VPRARGGDCARSVPELRAVYIRIALSGSVVFVNAVEAGHTARQMKLWYGVTNLHPQLTC